MTKRRELKKELSKLKYIKKSLPMLMDCDEVYGSDFYNKDYESKLDKDIADIETAIKGIDTFNSK